MAEKLKKSISEWNGKSIGLGESCDVKLAFTESYSSMTVEIPIRVQRAEVDGPVVFVTAALHGDEINGTGAIRELIHDEEFQITKGSLILVPVLNLLAFDRHSRYLPDRRDLNRSFPGSVSGSLAKRMAHTIYEELVSRSDYGIDLHTACIRRTNYPNVRGDLSNPKIKKLAKAFGSELIIDNIGPAGSFRRESSLAGCPTIIMEGGEIWKVEPGIVQVAVRGVKNVLRYLGMMEGESDSPGYQIIINKTKWIRADRGGFLNFHVQPGEIVIKNQPLATNTTLLGDEQSVLTAPFNGVVIGMTTLPAVSPGEPVCNIGKLPRGTKVEEFRRMRIKEAGLEKKVVDDLSSNVKVLDPTDIGYDPA